MLGNILVHLPTELPVRAAINGSISFALSTGAHLDVVAIGYERTIIPLLAIGVTAVTSVFDDEQARALDRAEAALHIFDLQARNAGISYTSRALSALPTDARRIICASARVHDMTIVTQPQSGYDSYDNLIPRKILCQAGRPVLYLPHIFHGAFSIRRVGICWDGSRRAARALHDAMPFLCKADALTIIATTAPDKVPADSSTACLGEYLAKSGLPAKVVSLPTSQAAQRALVSLTTDESLDLLVMGGYGRSRLQDRLLGTAGHMLRGINIPVLMSH
ncbi:nucleotide-binding universal stress UspA family protein [Bradyrhizobium sp. USDA 4532]|uniref:universal stress protein n=1 Tax=unclassified Bradyrhizobium TaxID=2631580 RepID=UPI00209EC389|nr:MULTISPECIES: universal stress protein [unclassified Bradyrhizobium]MCP1835201.1 nucleotide-binding universal stress UspA family protein [Bradyrhizobium sp. USDA 4545]MCP1919946.1 nucleotide-binding universal stress UspA family protein [Bradyrhizobium sp. USDA 4532]